MKSLKNTLFILTASFFIAACSSPNLGEKANVSEAKDVSSVSGEKQVMIVNTDNSKLEWIGAKPTGTHDGSLSIKDGELYLQDGNIAGGKFILDMMSIKNYDLKDPEWNSKLVNHLHSADFFNTSEFPEGVFEITSVELFDGTVAAGEMAPTHVISGNLTIKDITRNVKFNAFVQIDESGLMAESVQFVINRAEYDIRFKSKSFFNDLQDDFINDEIGLKVRLEAFPRG